MNKKNIFLSIASLLAIGLSLSSCLDEENPNTITPPTTFTATLNGASEKPTSTTSTATGTFTGSLNEATRVLSYTVTYTGTFSSSLTGGHIHRITPNSTTGTGPVEIPFANLTSPITGTVTLANKNRVDSLKNGFYYANLHTTVYPAGEIRGDIKKQ
ncbi:CHRD domain-containing protein [Spirosoma sp. KNUC1025]|uniref:CHRD domain-containing protein n=1 Tax=Spirosoma sp. KNUC1025 TaxID=2894082 RepID=UPI003869EB41|nr:CHRD domain-containing protein [Spirosoma sp. KNUC1025]